MKKVYERPWLEAEEILEADDLMFESGIDYFENPDDGVLIDF